MNSLVGHSLILVGAGAAAMAVALALEHREGAERPGGPVLVVVAPRAARAADHRATVARGRGAEK